MTAPLGRGVHIAFTGTDGSGKSTQAGLLTHRLNECGAQAYLAEAKDDFATQILRRVTGSVGSAGVRASIGNEMMDVVAALDSLRDQLRMSEPLLSTGINVVTPRSMYCRLAVGAAFGSEVSALTRKILAAAPEPDLVIWLDVPVTETVRRVAARGRDREDPEFMTALRNAISRLADHHRLHRIDATAPAADVHETIWRAVRNHLPGLVDDRAIPGAGAAHSAGTEPADARRDV